jgi:hypothetical protein
LAIGSFGVSFAQKACADAGTGVNKKTQSPTINAVATP